MESATRIRDLDYTRSRLRPRPGLECPDAEPIDEDRRRQQGFLGRRRSMSTRSSRRCASEVRRSGADPGGGGDPADRRAARDEAERLWPVSADRSLRLRPGVRGGVGTPVKAVLRKLMRWYVEPLAYDQRSFNAAALRLDRRPPGAGRPARRPRWRRLRDAKRVARDEDRRVQASGAVRATAGAEIFTDTLVEQLRARDHEAEIVSVPFKWYPGTRVLTQAFLWRLLDLTESDGTPIDMVVATKFPSYVVRHPEKRVWLVHQFRQAYELDRTELGQFGESPEERAVRRQVQELDRVALGEATRLFATSRNVAGRLERSTGLVAEVLPHPAQELDYRDDGPR